MSLVQIRDLSGDSEAADTVSLDISEVEPAYLNLSDLYDIKYLPFEFMIFRKVPKPAQPEPPPSPESEAGEELAEFPEAGWPWPGALGPPASLQITEEPEDMETLLRETVGSRKRKWSPPSGGLFHRPGRHMLLEEPVELGLRQRVRASMAHISRLLKGRPEGDSHTLTHCPLPWQGHLASLAQRGWGDTGAPLLQGRASPCHTQGLLFQRSPMWPHALPKCI